MTGTTGEYTPLVGVWARDGLASVVVGSLRAAGFHPLTDCDPRGWMHFYGWPLGSSGPLTIWIPESELEEARAYLSAPSIDSAELVEDRTAFTVRSNDWRRAVLGLWLANYVLSLVGLFLSGLGDLVTAFRGIG